MPKFLKATYFKFKKTDSRSLCYINWCFEVVHTLSYCLKTKISSGGPLLQNKFMFLSSSELICVVSESTVSCNSKARIVYYTFNSEKNRFVLTQNAATRDISSVSQNSATKLFRNTWKTLNKWSTYTGNKWVFFFKIVKGAHNLHWK